MVCKIIKNNQIKQKNLEIRKMYKKVLIKIKTQSHGKIKIKNLKNQSILNDLFNNI